MKTLALRRLLAPCLLVCVCCVMRVAGKESWVGMRSPNFQFVGNAGEKDVRRVATRLEQFRESLMRLFTSLRFESNVPTRVIVFKDKASFKPFNPRQDAGYFQAGEDVNYITLALDSDDAFSTVYHEYVHLLVNNTAGHAPTWFNEGLAEYYSTFRVEKDRTVFLGDFIADHIRTLREKQMLSLPTLLGVDHYSPHYNEKNKRGVFYAQSWALVHYLLNGNEGRRAGQLTHFLQLLAAGQSIGPAFQAAFQTDVETLEKELREYVRGNSFKERFATFEKELATGALTAAPLAETDANAYLGDLLLHTRDYAGAEARLQQALAADPRHPLANLSLGLLRARQNRFREAVQLLQQAAKNNAGNYLAHYYHAYALSRVGLDSTGLVGSYPADSVAVMRAELKRAIELAPTFPESYALLAFVNLVAGDALDESVKLLQRAVALAPGRVEFALTLGQVYLRQGNYALARQAVEPLTQTQKDPRLRGEAQQMLDVIKTLEEAKHSGGIIAGGMEIGPRPKRAAVEIPDQPERIPSPEELRDEAIRGALRSVKDGETRVLGRFLKLDCDRQGVAYFVVQTDARQFRIRSANLTAVQLVAYTELAGGRLTCGPRAQPETVVITFRPAAEAKDRTAKIDGDAIHVEIVPPDFKLTP
jgi:tetratricopeptide (TPR) repeat protein